MCTLSPLRITFWIKCVNISYKSFDYLFHTNPVYINDLFSYIFLVVRDHWSQYFKVSKIEDRLSLCLWAWGMLQFFIIPHVQTQMNLVWNFQVILLIFRLLMYNFFTRFYLFNVFLTGLLFYKYLSIIYWPASIPDYFIDKVIHGKWFFCVLLFLFAFAKFNFSG
jgi:hypothetical protein